ncbi:MAG: serine hydrolase [Chryseolinea sp.]
MQKSTLALLLVLATFTANAQQSSIDKKMKGFDAFMEKIMKEWNAPGLAVGIVEKDKLVFAKGYGYRDLEKKLPVTPTTLFPIASNTKLFTSVAAGLLVEDGKLEWDKPIKKFDPTIEFYSHELNESVTLRDMLSHRTGISRHDAIWYKSAFTRREMFERLKYMEPSQPLRQGYLYNNLMYMGVGYVIEHLAGKTWESFVNEKILNPLSMTATTFKIDDMEKTSDFAFPYYQKRDTTTLVKYPFYRQMDGVGPCGSIISNIKEMSHWLIALMNKGSYNGKQVLPASVLSATLQPAMAVPNLALESKGYSEVFNAVYGMGRYTASYKGHFLTNHGGAIGGFYSQVSTLLYDGYGVIVLVSGTHTSPMTDVVTRSIYDRLLGVSPTPWQERIYASYLAGKKAEREARKKTGSDKISGTKPSHPLQDYVGKFENPAYGVISITGSESNLAFDYNTVTLPLEHYHYDRFDTPDDELNGKWSINFSTNPQGDVDKVLISMDESEVSFGRTADAALKDPKTLLAYVGKYESPNGGEIDIKSPDSKSIFVVYPGQPQYELIPYKPKTFHLKQFSDTVLQFVEEGGKIIGFKSIDPSGEVLMKRK